MEELVSARLFFSFASGAGIVFGAVLAFFHSPSCCMIFFIVKALQEFFFLKSYIPAHPALLLSQAQRSNGPLLYLFIKQEIKLVWPYALFLRFAQKSCSCPVVLKRKFLKE